MDTHLRSLAHLHRNLHRLRRHPDREGHTLAPVEHPGHHTLHQVREPDAPSPETTPLLLIRNGRLLGSEDTVTVAVRGDRIVHVGPETEEGRRMAEHGATILDADGGTVLPGFCDSHVHLLVGSERYQGLDVEDVRSREDLLARLRAFAEKHPELEALHLYGLNYLEPPLLPADRARLILDEAVSHRPVFVYAHDLHTGWANTKAMEEADFLRPMPPFPDLLEHLHLTENVKLGEDGLPSGELKEPDVYFLVEGLLRSRHPLSADQKLNYVEQACADLAARGLTAIHNMGLAVPEEDVELLLLLLELEEKDRLPLRVHSSFSALPDDHALHDVRHAAEIRDALSRAREGEISAGELHSFLLEQMQKVTDLRHQASLDAADRHEEEGWGPLAKLLRETAQLARAQAHAHHAAHHLERGEDRKAEARSRFLDPRGRVQMTAVKVFMDGVIEKDTAYRSDREAVDGVPAFTQDQIDEVVMLADSLGLQVAAHCIGDSAVHSILDAIEKARKTNAGIDEERGHRIRHRVEHIEMCLPSDIPRFTRLDVIASMQPLHQRPPTTLWHRKVDRTHWKTAFPWRDLTETGATLIFGSDWPIVSSDCLEAFQRAATRGPWLPNLPSQGLALSAIVGGYTERPPYAEYQEKLRGRLETGQLADLVVLEEKLEGVPAEALREVGIRYTVSGGRVTFEGNATGT